MRKLLVFAIFLCALPRAEAVEVFNLNVFDQLQGKWEDGFRLKRMKALAGFIKARKPDIVVFQEAMGNLPGAQKGGEDSTDAARLTEYKHRLYLHEMTGDDGASYGYWIGAKKEPSVWLQEGFEFPGGVKRRVLAAVWPDILGSGKNKKCLGVVGLHFSYQGTEVRQREAEWVVDFLKRQETKCKQWLVLGDFNAEKEDKEIQILTAAGLKPLFSKVKPTVTPENPIRRIYGDKVPARAIDWAFGWNLDGAKASVVLDQPWKKEWVSDHAGLWVSVKDVKTAKKKKR